MRKQLTICCLVKRARFSEMATNVVFILIYTFILYIKFIAVFASNHAVRDRILNCKVFGLT